MKIAVVGSREFKNIILIDAILDQLFGQFVENILVSGGARGVDSIAEKYYKKLNRLNKPIIFKAKWDDLSHSDAIIKTNRYGKKYDARAGMRRNQLIVNEADLIVAFWSDQSSGTKSTIDLAIKANKPVDIYVR